MRRSSRLENDERNDLNGCQKKAQEVWDLDEVVVKHTSVDEPESSHGKARQDHVERQDLGRPKSLITAFSINS